MSNVLKKYLQDIEEKNKMDVLMEKHYTGLLYHSTKLWSAKDILSNDVFRLSSVDTRIRSDQLKSKNAYPEVKLHRDTMKDKEFSYYMSMSRSKMNSYREIASHHPDTYNVTLVIDGSKYSNKKNVKIGPVDYFNYAPRDDKETYKWEMGEISRKSEAEERIWSTYPTIPAVGIIEVHCLIDKYDLKDEFMPIIIERCGAKEIPLFVYIYDSEEDLVDILHDYLKLDKRKAKRMA